MRINRHCPVCNERVLNPFRALLWPRCKVCGSKFRRRLALGIPLVGDYAGSVVFVGALFAAVLLSDRRIAGVGLVAFVVLELVIFRVSRLEPDARDPVTNMQVRRFGRRGRSSAAPPEL